MSLEPYALESALDCVSVAEIQSIWDATTRAELDHAAASALTSVWVWSVPRCSPLPAEWEHARSSLVAYVVSSTLRMRRQELRGLRLGGRR